MRGPALIAGLFYRLGSLLPELQHPLQKCVISLLVQVLYHDKEHGNRRTACKMQKSFESGNERPTRIAGATAAVISTPALAQGCECGPPGHEKDPPVFLDYDQVELDAAYDQERYEPLIHRVDMRIASNSEAAIARLGMPERVAYGTAEVEKLEIYRTDRANAPIFVFIHGGTWRYGSAREYAYAAEMFIRAGAHYVAIDFASVIEAGGDLNVLATQVRKAIAWVYRNAAGFDGDPDRLYVGGHSSGGHLCAAALITDWQKEFGLPADIIKGGLCMSGLYEMEPVRLSWRRGYINFTDEMADAMSPQRHVERLRASVVVTYGSFETPEFRRQGRDFAATAMAAGKSVELIEAPNYHHQEMAESLGNPYGPNGRAALALMGLNAA
jgi:arylformamidase